MPTRPTSERRDDQRRRIAPAERQREPGLGQLGRQRRTRPDQLHGEIGAEREQRTVREIDLLHQSDDQHEAERDQGEQQPERQAVDEMRKKIEQVSSRIRVRETGRSAARRTRAREAHRRVPHRSGIDGRHLLVGHELALAGASRVRGGLRLGPADDLVEVGVVGRLGVAPRQIDRLLHLVRHRIHVGIEMLHAVGGRDLQVLELLDDLDVVGRAGALDRLQQFARRHVAVVGDVARHRDRPSLLAACHFLTNSATPGSGSL